MKNEIVENSMKKSEKDIKWRKTSIGNNTVLYNDDEIIIETFYDLFDLMNYLSKLVKQNNELAFRGHSSANYQLVSSLLRLEDGEEKEGKYYFDIIKSYPKIFTYAKYHLDYLKVMQHYGAKTRILDISINFLSPIYFAVEK